VSGAANPRTGRSSWISPPRSPISLARSRTVAGNSHAETAAAASNLPRSPPKSPGSPIARLVRNATEIATRAAPHWVKGRSNSQPEAYNPTGRIPRSQSGGLQPEGLTRRPASKLEFAESEIVCSQSAGIVTIDVDRIGEMLDPADARIAVSAPARGPTAGEAVGSAILGRDFELDTKLLSAAARKPVPPVKLKITCPPIEDGAPISFAIELTSLESDGEVAHTSRCEVTILDDQTFHVSAARVLVLPVTPLLARLHCLLLACCLPALVL
jgi:hypothetical protein